jgi:mannosylglycerate hydrolase
MDRKIVHFVSHTHWDKEWYKTYEEFRIKFIKYFREILEVLENDEGFESFMFDGQSSVVDDYLQIYPAERDRLIKLITAEKLIIGPWYTLPDNYLTSGESLSRNLLIGSNMARELGHTQNVCYIPDSFGQSDAMPQIINEMNLKGTILWRGIDSTQTNNAAFRWKGSSGDEVFAVHLPLGYGYSKKIPKDGSHLEYMKEICNLLEKKYVDNIMLHMGGSDHQPIQKMVPKFIADINDKWKENNQNIEMKMSTLDAFFDDIKKHVDHKSLTLLEGELRSVRDQRVHYGDASGRMDLKKLNRNIELKLAKIVEPILSIGSSLFNERYEKEMINYAWKLLFANQAHDSACATCTDEAHLDMYNRFLKADQIANELINYTNKNIFAKVKLNDSFGDPFIIYNTSAENIKFKSEVTIYSKEKNFKILNSNGEEIKFDLLDQSLVNMNFENIDYCNFVSMTSFGDDYMQKNKGESFDKGFIPFYKNVIRISNNVVPNIGFDIMYVKNCDSILLNSNNKKINTDNIFGKYSINNNGTVALKIGDLDFDNLGYFESVGEAGDSYDYSPPEFDKKYTTLNEQPKIKVLKNTEHFCEVLVSYDWMLPSSLIDEDTKRSEELVQK